MPKLNALYKKYLKNGLVIIGVHSDPNAQEGAKAVKDEGIAYPVALDGGKLMNALDCDSFPDYVLVDRKGILRFNDLANGEVDRAVEALLKEKG